MEPLRIENFGGLVLTKDEKKGPFWTALKASNCDVQSGSIDVAYNIDTSTAAALTGVVARKKIFNLSGATFLEWSTSIQIAVSPLADNSTKRIYFTGSGVPQVTDLALATAGAAPYPAKSYVLGLPAPPKIAGVGAAGGVAPVETRAYTYTMVSPWGEESAPAGPYIVNANTTGATVNLAGVGAVSRVYPYNLAFPDGIPITSASFLLSGGQTFLVFQVTNAAHYKDFNIGDRIWLNSNPFNAADIRATDFLIAGRDVVGGQFSVLCNVWVNIVGAFKCFRVLPANSFNILTAVKDTPAVGQVTVSVDTTAGLRPTENLSIASVVGMTDINGTFAVVSVGTDLENPSFVITKTTAQVYTSGGVATRVEKHNTGEFSILAAAFAAGVCTVTVESTAHINVGDKVLILGCVGPNEMNGLRTVTSVPSATTFTFACTSAAAYVQGGIVIIAGPYLWNENTVNNVTSAGGPFPNAFTITVTVNKAHDFVVGDKLLVYDVTGAVEANALMIVVAISTFSISFNTGRGVSAYTGGGKVVRASSQRRKNIYRTAQGNTGAEFELVDSIPGERGYYTDTKDATALGDILESDGWIQPPVDMSSMLAHPHGFLGAASKNILCLSVPEQPHAWPLANEVPLPSDIVATGLFGTTIVAFTQEIPYLVGGYTPDQMTRQRMDVGERCTSARSVVSTGLGVFYRGTSGMFLIGSDASDNVTKNFLPASTFLASTETVSAFWGNKIVWIDVGTQSGYVFDPVREDKGLTTFDVDYPVYDLHVSPVDGQLYASYMDAGTPKRAPLFKIVANPAKFTYWTQYIRFPTPLAVGALQVDWRWDMQSATLKDRENVIERNSRLRKRGAIDQDAIDVAPIGGSSAEQVYSPDTTPSVPTERFLRVKLIANPDRDDAVTLFDDFVVSTKPVRVSNGVKADVFQVQFIGNAKVSAVTLAESIHELRSV